jgi:restriction system protein
MTFNAIGRSATRDGGRALQTVEKGELMAESNAIKRVPKYHELMFPCLKALKALSGSGTNEEILDKVCELEKYPAEIQQVQHSDKRQSALNYSLAWARTYLRLGGAIENSERGVWTLTEKGANLTEEDCRKISAEVRKASYEKRKSKGEEQLSGEDENEESSWRDTLLSVLLELTPHAFERLAQRILREAGFTRVQVTGKSGDGGIDGIGILRVNLVSFVVLFQCKRYKNSVGSGAVRDFRGAMQGRCDKGLIITTGTFSPDARSEATRDGAPAIDLIDGEALCDLLKSLKLGVEIKHVEEVTVKPEWFSQI